MEGLMPVIKEAIVSGVMASATRRGPRKQLAGMGVITLAGLVFFLAVVFMALAGYEWLAGVYSSPFACFVIGLALAFASAIVFFIGRSFMSSYEKQVGHASREEVGRLIDLLAEDISGELAGPIRDNPKTSLAVAAVAGFLAGDRLH